MLLLNIWKTSSLKAGSSKTFLENPCNEKYGNTAVVHRQHFPLLTLYRLHFASDLHERLSEHSSPSNLGQV